MEEIQVHGLDGMMNGGPALLRIGNERIGLVLHQDLDDFQTWFFLLQLGFRRDGSNGKQKRSEAFAISSIDHPRLVVHLVIRSLDELFKTLC